MIREGSHVWVGVVLYNTLDEHLSTVHISKESSMA